MKIKEFEELKSKFKQLEERNKMSFEELFPDDFIKKHTKSKNLNDFFKNSGFKIDSAEDFAAIPDNSWEEYIIENTQFTSWLAMQKTAHDQWLAKWADDNLK